MKVDALFNPVPKLVHLVLQSLCHAFTLWKGGMDVRWLAGLAFMVAFVASINVPPEKRSDDNNSLVLAESPWLP